MKAFLFGPDRGFEGSRDLAEPLPERTDDGYRLILVNTPQLIEHEPTAIYQRDAETREPALA